MGEQTTIHIEDYYTSQGYFEKRFKALSRQMGFNAATLEEYAIWKNQMRAELADLTGLTTMERCEPAPQVSERNALDGYVREKVLLQTEPGVIMPLYVLIPEGLTEGERRPPVIAPHGHGSAGKFVVAGRTDIPAVKEGIKTYNYDYGVQLVRQGLVVFCPDARGFGERREPGMQGDEQARFMSSSCNLLNHMAIPLGQTVTGMWTWDLIRLADYAATRPECDSSRLGCAGLSGGGLQTLWFAAMDDRVKCAVVSGYFYGYKESLLELNGNCSCNYVPHLWEKVDMGDIAALIAPRPLLIETGDKDPLNGKSGVDNVLPQVEITRRAYRLLGADDRLFHHIFPGEHRWSGEKAIPWLKRHLSTAGTQETAG